MMDAPSVMVLQDSENKSASFVQIPGLRHKSAIHAMGLRGYHADCTVLQQAAILFVVSAMSQRSPNVSVCFTTCLLLIWDIYIF